MSFLKEIPFVMPLAEFVWGTGDVAGEGDPVSADICLESLPLLTIACLQRLIVKGLGIAIILGAFLNKAPIIVNMWNAQTAAGMAKASVYGEVIMYSNAALYGFLEGYPITAYGENAALTMQSLIIVTLLWKFSKTSIVEAGAVMTFFMAYWLGSIFLLPSEYYSLLMGSITPVLLYSRGSQVLQNFQEKHTGTQALATVIMNLAGGIIRIGTTIAEVGWDIPTLSGYATGVSLSLMLFIQYFAYRKNTAKILEELQKQKKE